MEADPSEAEKCRQLEPQPGEPPDGAADEQRGRREQRGADGGTVTGSAMAGL